MKEKIMEWITILFGVILLTSFYLVSGVLK
jgi:hypothetical protein